MPTINMRKEMSKNDHRRRHSSVVLVGDERELHELACLSGVLIDPQVFKIIVDLIRFHISPSAIMEMLKSISEQHKHAKDATVCRLMDNFRNPAV